MAGKPMRKPHRMAPSKPISMPRGVSKWVTRASRLRRGEPAGKKRHPGPLAGQVKKICAAIQRPSPAGAVTAAMRPRTRITRSNKERPTTARTRGRRKDGSSRGKEEQAPFNIVWVSR